MMLCPVAALPGESPSSFSTDSDDKSEERLRSAVDRLKQLWGSDRCSPDHNLFVASTSTIRGEQNIAKGAESAPVGISLVAGEIAAEAAATSNGKDSSIFFRPIPTKAALGGSKPFCVDSAAATIAAAAIEATVRVEEEKLGGGDDCGEGDRSGWPRSASPRTDEVGAMDGDADEGGAGGDEEEMWKIVRRRASPDEMERRRTLGRRWSERRAHQVHMQHLQQQRLRQRAPSPVVRGAFSPYSPYVQWRGALEEPTPRTRPVAATLAGRRSASDPSLTSSSTTSSRAALTPHGRRQSASPSGSPNGSGVGSDETRVARGGVGGADAPAFSLAPAFPPALMAPVATPSTAAAQRSSSPSKTSRPSLAPESQESFRRVRFHESTSDVEAGEQLQSASSSLGGIGRNVIPGWTPLEVESDTSSSHVGSQADLDRMIAHGGFRTFLDSVRKEERLMDQQAQQQYEARHGSGRDCDRDHRRQGSHRSKGSGSHSSRGSSRRSFPNLDGLPTLAPSTPSPGPSQTGRVQPPHRGAETRSVPRTDLFEEYRSYAGTDDDEEEEDEMYFIDDDENAPVTHARDKVHDSSAAITAANRRKHRRRRSRGKSKAQSNDDYDSDDDDDADHVGGAGAGASWGCVSAVKRKGWEWRCPCAIGVIVVSVFVVGVLALEGMFSTDAPAPPTALTTTVAPTPTPLEVEVAAASKGEGIYHSDLPDGGGKNTATPYLFHPKNGD